MRKLSGVRSEAMKILRTVLVGSLVAIVSFGVLAQSAGPRDLAELKQEAQRRADRSLPPVSGISRSSYCD